jgi:hypothetical protein
VPLFLEVSGCPENVEALALPNPSPNHSSWASKALQALVNLGFTFTFSVFRKIFEFHEKHGRETFFLLPTKSSSSICTSILSHPPATSTALLVYSYCLEFVVITWCLTVINNVVHSRHVRQKNT